MSVAKELHPPPSAQLHQRVCPSPSLSRTRPSTAPHQTCTLIMARPLATARFPPSFFRADAAAQRPALFCFCSTNCSSALPIIASQQSVPPRLARCHIKSRPRCVSCTRSTPLPPPPPSPCATLIKLPYQQHAFPIQSRLSPRQRRHRLRSHSTARKCVFTDSQNQSD